MISRHHVGISFTTRGLVVLNKASLFASTRWFQSVTAWAGHADVWCGLMGLLSFNVCLFHRIDPQFQSEKSRAEKQFISFLACIIWNYDGGTGLVSNTVRPLETQVKVDMDIANQIVVCWILFAYHYILGALILTTLSLRTCPLVLLTDTLLAATGDGPSLSDQSER